MLSTDVNRQMGGQGQQSASKFKLKMLEKLPAPLYVDSNVETSFRIETNPFQEATKRALLRQLNPPGNQPSDPMSVISLDETIRNASKFNNVYRVNPNVTVGWSPTGNTQFFASYFYLRDQLTPSSKLNSNTHAVGIGAQHTFQLTKRLSFQPQMQMRELFQTEQPPVFDYLPAATFTFNRTDSLTFYINALLQARFKNFIDGPMRELDPFYSWGATYQKNGWYFSASTTFNQNFRHPFRQNALLPIDNYSFISDFEIDRQFKKIQGVQWFVRAEPVWNFHSQKTNGLSGMDFRFYYGVRLSASKPALTGTMDQLRKRFASNKQ